MHINLHFSLHINVNVPELANELISVRSSLAGYNKPVGPATVV